jgi:hypothetical protein
MTKLLLLLLLFSLPLLIMLGMTASGKSFIGNNEQINERTRLVVLADMGNEADEMQQMMHLLVYNNEIDIEGLFAVTGIWLHPNFKGDPYRRKLHPELFDSLINGYSKVFENLRLHANGWKSPEYLQSIVKTGQSNYGIDGVGEGKTSQGSEFLTKIILKDDPRPVYIVVNAGSNTLAQALWDYRNTHSKSEIDAFVSKLIVYENGAQDDAGGWIVSQFPAIHWIRSNYQTYAYGGSPEGNDKSYTKLQPCAWEPYPFSAEGAHAWAKENIQTKHGALGNLYPDRIMGNRFWPLEGGGTVPWLGLTSGGLYDPYHPNWGGFSGRYTSVKKSNVWSRHAVIAQREKEDYGEFKVFTDTSDNWVDPSDKKVYSDNNTPIHRWQQLLFDDFKCRMDWCVEPYEKANHNPVIVLNDTKNHTIVNITALPGEKLSFNASKSYDPDKNQKLTFSWWFYPEAGNYKGDITLKNRDQKKLVFTVPIDASNKQIHLILDVYDDSNIAPMHDIRRIVIHVKE